MAAVTRGWAGRRWCPHQTVSCLVVMAGAVPPSHTPRRLQALRDSIGMLFITKRPRPARPRAVKMSKTQYPDSRKAAPLK
ncbi:hypothetical protein CJF34_12255 [Pseudomonas lundensis]|nr:hypothetical protein CJF36_11605 [Pseudomonas lundensis]OZY50344.1 hypothetical protein CJF34_12255 [Pseudomonas lundensis]